MSGHSKWNNIKGTKEKSDAQRAKIFTKLSREIAVAIKSGGADPDSNGKLKIAVIKARQNNMPNDKINSLLKKSNDDKEYFETTYEGYGVGGVAVIVECLTDNKNRTASDVRHLFDKYGGSLGSTGCVSYMFERKGVIVLEKDGKFNVETAVDIAIMNDAMDYEDGDEIFTVYTKPYEYETLCEEYQKNNYNILSSENELIANNFIALEPEQKDKFDIMLEKFDELDDVQNVYHNLED